MLSVEPTAIPDVKIITPKKHGDHRGFFSETWSRKAFQEAGLDLDFVQDNQSLSAAVGTLRGLHFQSPPFAQDKLVRVTKGRILDVAVDLRVSSPTFGRHVKEVLSAENWRQFLVPVGFAHGFLTLEPDTEVLYKVTAPYDAASDHGVAFDHPALGIDWLDPEFGIDKLLRHDQLVLSDKDRKHPRQADLPRCFP